MKEIPIDQIDARLHAENPWWNESHKGSVSSVESMTPRLYLDLFLPLVADRSVRRAVVLMGPRRVGKTVMIHHAIAQLIKDGTEPRAICYVSVDNPLYNGMGLEAFLAAYERIAGRDYRQEECLFFFDEIQYLRDWEIHLKSAVDSYEPAKFVVSGSSAAALRLKSNESGAGRFTDFLLPPLMFIEYLRLLKVDDPVVMLDAGSGAKEELHPGVNYDTLDIERLTKQFIDYMNFGGYPEVALSPAIQEDPGRFVKSDIIDKVLLRDLPSLYGIQDIQELNSLFTTLVYNTANEVSLEKLSQGSGVTKSTIKRYIEYLESAFLIKVVHRVDRNAKRFKRAASFKIYVTNPSIRAAVFAPINSEDEAMGALVETAIISQLLHTDFNYHYARWGTGEVDLVHLGPDQKADWAMESKWSDRFYDHPGELKSLVRFCHEQNLSKAVVTSKTKYGTIMRESVSLNFVPASVYCYSLGRSIIQSKGIPTLW